MGWSFYSQGTKERATAADEFLNWGIKKLAIRIKATSATAKGEAIAEEMAKRRVLLVLDGVEPLQHGLGTQLGELKDPGRRSLLRRFATMPPAEIGGRLVLTSRLAVKDISRWKDGAAPIVEVEQLSDEAGAALLRDNGVWGIDKEPQATSKAFGGHPLALGLLASFLAETQFGNVRRRDHIRELLDDPESPRHDHAWRVMESYEKEWLADKPVPQAIMHIVGLFDRPANVDCLRALRKKPIIPGFTDAIVGLDERAWLRAIARLREVRLLAPQDPGAPDALDAHPLVREWFGQRLMETKPDAWRAAHSRLYEHLRDTTKKGETPTLEGLAPLYQAVSHGCRSGRHQEALHDIYVGRISRLETDGEPESYAFRKLGAVGSNLAAISWFFEKLYDAPVHTLASLDQARVLREMAYALRAQGRIADALPPIRTELRMYQANSWRNAAVGASNLSRVQLLVGQVAAAVTTAQQSVAYADEGGDEFQMMNYRIACADALHAAGRGKEAEELFADAERRRKEQQVRCPVLHWTHGYLYCDLLLTNGKWTAALDQRRALEIAGRNDWLLFAAFDALTFARAHLGLALDHCGAAAAVHYYARTARDRFREAVDGLRAAGTFDQVPCGLLGRAAFHRSVGDWSGAARDLNEVEEIAEPGPMKLYLCDMALERARLAFARIEAFSPLNGLVDDSARKPKVPTKSERQILHDEAAKQLAIAADYITKCGYHRRDKELAELEAVLAGQRRFADLLPRVSGQSV